MRTLGIIETGVPPGDLKQRFGSYGDMFRRLLGHGYEYAYYDVRNDQWPERAGRHDVYLITGSASGVYDGEAWIDALKTFVLEISGRTPLIGICFGHQVMAEAYGGRVTKSPRGWGIGLHSYEIARRAEWMADDDPSFSIPVSHQDQVVELPKDATLLASSTFTPNAAVEYSQRRAISFQGHPEFSPEYAAALIDLRRATRFKQDFADAALASLQRPNDSARLAGWLRRFIEAQVPAQGSPAGPTEIRSIS